ncbi:MAG: HAMP domain-containing histidine kinase [Oscillospiraceae bacterium]|nr:HAMP domain-containing histidine kinase [Oscillospiraceae bacterium]
MFIKKDIRNLNKQLALIKTTDTNTRLTTETFDKDITELCNSMNAVLDERREAVIEAEKTNAEFKRAVTNISHDLRTPLTSAIGYLQMVRQENDSANLAIIEERLKSLTTLMNSLFEYTKLIEGRVMYNPGKVNLCDILRDTLAQFYGDFTAKGFEVVLDIPDKPVYAVCDKSAVERVVQNLVKNALQHGYKRFELCVDETKIVFSNCVCDIENLDVEKMFERFYTADLSRMSGNTGLGLAIAKELAEVMGWKIKAETRFSETASISIALIFNKKEVHF